MKLISQGGSLWLSEDERVLVNYQTDFETECDEPHPVKMRLDSMTRFSDWYRKRLLARGRIVSRRTKEGWVEYLTYQCQGGESHFYGQWVVQIDGEWTDNVYERFADAIQTVEEKTGEKVTLVRPRKAQQAQQSEPARDPDTGLVISGWGIDYDRSHPEQAQRLTREAELREELQALEDNIDRMVTMMATEDGPYVDRELLASNRERKLVVEQCLRELEEECPSPQAS